MNIIIDEEPFVQSYDSILVQKLKQSNQENFNDNCKSKKFLRLSELAESNLYNIMDIRENCTAEESIVTVVVDDFSTVSSILTGHYKVRSKYLLIDSLTGYRCLSKRLSFGFNI